MVFYVLKHINLCVSFWCVGSGAFENNKKEIAMEHWSRMLNQTDKNRLDEKDNVKQSFDEPCREVRLPKRHYIIDSKKFPGVYFTYRETQCMTELMRGKTIKSTGETLGLSPRTVEYYLKNMKSKLKCRTKSELMQLIAGSEMVKLLY